MQCGFSLTQIGEFAFIIAALGVSLNVTSSFLYPIVVAVSVITTFLTPYMIRLSGPAYGWVDRHSSGILEAFAGALFGRSAACKSSEQLEKTVGSDCAYHIDLSGAFHCDGGTVIQPVPSSFDFRTGRFWGKVLGAVVTILLISPFLRAMIMKKNHSIEFKALWADSRFNHAPLISIVCFALCWLYCFVVYIIKYLFPGLCALMVGIAILVVSADDFSPVS